MDHTVKASIVTGPSDLLIENYSFSPKPTGNPADSTIETNEVVKPSARLNLRRWLFRRAARRYGFYRAFLGAERAWSEAREESERRAIDEGLGEDAMRSGFFGEARATVLFCIVVLLAACAAEGLR